MEPDTLPIVLTISGNDPTGGAGLIADVEAIISQGCHALPVVSCLTVQDTCDVSAVEAVDAELVLQQARAVLEDLPVDAVKIGLLGEEDVVEAVHELLADYADIPVVLDPIIASGSGRLLVGEDVVEAMKELLFPFTTVLTPNTQEVRAMVPGADSIQAAVGALREMGCEWVLVTGTHENLPDVINRLYGEEGEIEHWRWERLPENFHGSGCTLSAALAGLLAQGMTVPEAAMQAQDYTWRALNAGFRLGMGQLHPNRLFWVDETPEKNDGNGDKE